jgi:hypothetical protein
MISMTLALLIAGIGILLAGLVGIGFGIPVKEFSFGNTLIVTGVIAACTGMIMLGLWAIVRELKTLAQQAGSGVAPALRAATLPRSIAAGAAPRDSVPESDGFPYSREQPGAARPGDAEPADAAWQDEAASHEGPRNSPPVPPPAEAVPAAKPRRNLLFSSSSRKERERAEARTADPSAADVRSPLPAAPPPLKPSETPPPPPPPVTFDDAWPQSERARSGEAPLQRRSGRTPSTFTEPGAGASAADRYSPAARSEEHPPVTVLKSGVVDGMAYSLYSDGSIEAQMPEGMMRFASIDELRSHLDQRP